MAVLLICSLNRVSLHARLALLRCMAPANNFLLMRQYNIRVDHDYYTLASAAKMHGSQLCPEWAH